MITSLSAIFSLLMIGGLFAGVMEISQLMVLLKNLSSFFQLQYHENKCSELVQMYHQKIKEILKLIKPVLESIADAEVASDESLQKEFSGLSQCVDELKELLEDCHPLMSKVYFVCLFRQHFYVIHTHAYTHT